MEASLFESSVRGRASMIATRSPTVLIPAITGRGALAKTGPKAASHASMRSSKSIESSQKPPPQSGVLASGSGGTRLGPEIWTTISSSRARVVSVDKGRSGGTAVHDNSVGACLEAGT